MDNDLLESFWEIAKHYVKDTELQQFSDHLINELIERGAGDTELRDLSGRTVYFAHSCEQYIEEIEEIEEETYDWDE